MCIAPGISKRRRKLLPPLQPASEARVLFSSPVGRTDGWMGNVWHLGHYVLSFYCYFAEKGRFLRALRLNFLVGKGGGEKEGEEWDSRSRNFIMRIAGRDLSLSLSLFPPARNSRKKPGKDRSERDIASPLPRAKKSKNRLALTSPG